MDIFNGVKNKKQNIEPSVEVISSWKNFKKPEPRKSFFSKEKAEKIKIFFKDHWHLLIKSSAENHLRIQECKNIKEGQACNLSFDSYSELKRYQKKVRLFTYSFSSTALSIAIAIFAVQIFFGTGSSQGKAYTWTQENWLITKIGANTAQTASGPPDDFRDYASKDSGIAPVDVPLFSDYGRGVELTPQVGNVTQTNDVDFNSGTKTQTEVVGTGNSASVALPKGIIKIDGSSSTGAFTLNLKSDGTVWSFGPDNWYGNLGTGDNNASLTPLQVKDSTGSGYLSNIVDVAAGNNHALAVDKNGFVWAWGSNDYYELGDNTTTARNLPVKVQKSGGGDFTNAKAVSAGKNYSMILDGNGEVWIWGWNYNGYMGLGVYGNQNAPTKIATLSGITAISSAKSGNISFTNYAIKSDGTIWGWGYAYGTNTPGNTYEGRNDVKAVVAGDSHSAILTTNGKVRVLGSGYNGMNGDGTTNGRNPSFEVPGLSGIVMIAHGYRHLVALKNDGTVWAWGYNYYGQLGDGSTVDALSPVSVAALGSDNILIGASGYASFAMKKDGTVSGFGTSMGDGSNATRKTPVSLRVFNNNHINNAEKIGNTTGISWAIAGGKMYTWGAGNGIDYASASLPQQVPGLNNVTEAATTKSLRYSSDVAFFAIDSGKLYVWGNDQYGILGDDTVIANKNTPIWISSLGNTVVKVSASAQHVLALKSDGTVWAWGRNIFGQLGKGNKTDDSSNYIPVQIGGALAGKNIISVGAAGGRDYQGYSLALDDQGNVYSWGSGRYGVTGLNSSGVDVSIPTQVSISGVIAISGGSNHALALKGDGTVWAWGENSAGMLGDGTNEAQVWERTFPVQITKVDGGSCEGSLSGICTNTAGIVSGIEAGTGSSAIMLPNGNTYVWGLNSFGQLGLGNYTNVSLPTLNVALQNATDVKIDGFLFYGIPISSLARKSDGTVFGAGHNNYGQFGDGTFISRNSFMQAWGLDSNGYSLGLPYLPGNFTSATIDLGQKTKDGSLKLNWTQTPGNVLNDNAIGFQVSSDAAGNLTTFLGVDGDAHADCNTPGTCYAFNALGTVLNSQHNGARYLKYKAFLKTADQSVTPKLDSVSFDYDYYTSTGLVGSGSSLTSSWYNTTDFGNHFQSISWDESNVPSGTQVKFKIRTAPDNGSGSPGTSQDVPEFVGLNEGIPNTSTYFGCPGGTCSSGCSKTGTVVACTIPDNTAISNNIDDQWLQYKLTMDSEGQNTPRVEQVKLDYVVNTPPSFSALAKNQANLQDSDGILKFNYTVTDADQSTFITSYGVDFGVTTSAINSSVEVIPLGGAYSNLPSGTHNFMIDREQVTCTVSGSSLVSCARGSSASSHSAGATLWFLAETKTGAGVSKNKDENYQATWNIKQDLPGIYKTGAKLRVIANDDQLANNISLESGATLTFILDTKNPTGVSFLIDNSKDDAQLTIATPSDDSAYQMAFSKLNDFSDNPTYVSFSGTYTFNLDPDPVKLYMRVKDEYGNLTQFSTTTPAQPKYVVYYDTSNAVINDFREFIAWDVLASSQVGSGFYAYKLYRSVDNINYSIVPGGIIENRSMNFYADTGLNDEGTTLLGDISESTLSLTVSNASDFPEYGTIKIGTEYLNYSAKNGNELTVSRGEKSTTAVSHSSGEKVYIIRHYYYKITAVDKAGNVSAYSTKVEDTPDGQGGSDTTPPSISNVKVPANSVSTTSARIEWETDELSDSTIRYSAGDTSYGKTKTIPSVSTKNHKIVLTDLIPGTTYHFKLQSRDIASNLAENYEALPGLNLAGDFVFTTPMGPSISNVVTLQTSNSQAVIGWQTDILSSSYVYYSKDISNGVLVNAKEVKDQRGVSGQHTLNISKLESGTRYYYYVKSNAVENGIENLAKSATDNQGEDYYMFNTSSDTIPPVIIPLLDNPVVNTDTQTALVFATDKQTQLQIRYKKIADLDYGSNDYQAWDNNANYNKNYAFILKDLEPNNVEYFYEVRARDINENLAVPISGTFVTSLIQNDHAKLSNPGNPVVNQKSDTEAVVSLPDVNTTATSKLCYSESVIANLNTCVDFQEISTPTQAHFFHLEGLKPNTTYHLKTEITDSEVSNNLSFTSNDITFVTKKIQLDQQDALTSISKPGEDDITLGTGFALVKWTTNQNANSAIGCSTTSGDYTDITANSLVDFTKNHLLKIDGLAENTKYYCQITSIDSLTPANPLSETFDFTAPVGTAFNHPPLSEIIFDEKNPSILTDTKAVISFTTDQPAKCILASNEQLIPEIINSPLEESSYNIRHDMQLSGLKIFLDYDYTLHCHDNILYPGEDEEGNKIEEYHNISSVKKSFKTLEKQGGAGDFANGDTNSPAINNISVVSVTGESAMISWETDEEASSVVGYGSVNGAYSNSAGDYEVNSDKAKYLKSHSVILSGLVPATKYYFVASSTDSSGNIGKSAQNEFVTASPSSLSSIKAVSKNLGEAEITWNTSSETSSTVEYGLTTSYGEKKENSTQTKEHSINLSSLNQGVTYHYRVKGKDQDGKLYASSDQTFEPKSPPQISNIVANDINEHEATINFETNVPTTATVNYTNVQDQADNGSQANNEMATKHSIQIKNMTQGATFKIQIKARDEQGTESSQDAKDLTTGKDENPPKIDMVKTDLALAQNDKVQAIISWTTDEQATTSVIYKEGRNAEPKEIKVSDALTPAHIAVITAFKPGTVYYFNTKSVDASGNEARSSDYALLTPKRKENIIQIIIGNFTDIFGWAKF